MTGRPNVRKPFIKTEDMLRAASELETEGGISNLTFSKIAKRLRAKGLNVDQLQVRYVVRTRQTLKKLSEKIPKRTHRIRSPVPRRI